MKKAIYLESGYEIIVADAVTGEVIEEAITSLDIDRTLIENGYTHLGDRELSREQWNKDYAKHMNRYGKEVDPEALFLLEAAAC